LEPKGPITDMDRSKVESALTELYANEIHSPHSIRTLAFITLLLAASVLAAYYIL